MADKKTTGWDKAFEATGKWVGALRDYPGFNDWKKKALAATISHGDPHFELLDLPDGDFPFPPHITKQHEAIMAFFALHTTWQAFADTEYYFRRFPFRDLPVAKDVHIRYTCEAYFSRAYEFKERLKKAMNAINLVIAEPVDAGFIIRHFNAEFAQEIKARNLIHHHNRFDDIQLDRIALEGMMAMARDGDDRGWSHEQRTTYRRVSREWAERASRRSAKMKEYLDAVGEVVADRCQFLTDPVTIEPH